MHGWRAYSADGSTVDSAAVGSWTDLGPGVVGVVEFLDPPYRKVVDGGDWLWMEGGRWRASGTVWDGWVARPHPDAVRGAAMDDGAWREIHRRMIGDRRWP